MEVITGETDPARKKEFGRNYKTIIPTLDVLIVSPTITAGISFDDPKHFYRRYGYYAVDTFNFLTAVQQQYRVRNVESNNSIICIGPPNFHVTYAPTDLEVIRRGILNREVLKELEFEYGEDGRRSYREDLYFRCYINKERIDTISRNNFAGNYLQLERQAGCKLEKLAGFDGDKRKQLSSDIDKAYLEVTEEEAKLVASQPDISDFTFDSLHMARKYGQLSEADRPRWQSGWLKRFYNVPTLSELFVLLYSKRHELKMYHLHNRLAASEGYHRTDYVLRQLRQEHSITAAVAGQQADLLDITYEKVNFLAQILGFYCVDLRDALDRRRNVTISPKKIAEGNVEFVKLVAEKTCAS